ncbi:3-oxoacyl-[acyl-carrier-protein] synthase III C-terminal domain-containing protein [Nocardia sp. N2S4-5]|uniref:3-oxoacyl-[acyl-carrier-protein] synthase III C-terminal domain-containing protein n=1 Tax=Nocardia sp. N2S4-5 TaxID=3351565 RepID=UPI0037D4696F
MTMYLSSFGVALGDFVPLDRLPGTSAADVADHLADGLSGVRVSHASPFELATRAVRRSLRGGSAEPVDHIVFATATANARDATSYELADFLRACDLVETPVVGTGMNRCANFGALLGVGGSFLHAGTAGKVLLVTADGPPLGERILAGGIGIFSDGAAGAVLSRAAPPGPHFVVRGHRTVSDARLATAPDLLSDPRAAMRFLDRIDNALDSLLSNSGTTREDIALLVTNNYLTSTVEQIAEILDVPNAAVFRDSYEFGHCFAADPLLALAELTASQRLVGTNVLVAATAINIWSLTLLQYGRSVREHS